MKDNMLAYEFKPDAMSELTPAPKYIEKGLNKHMHHHRDGKFNLERHRTSVISRRQNEMRYAQGRLYSHLKLDHIKRGVKELRDKAHEEELRSKGVKAQKEETFSEKYEIDDQMNLPIGTEFDFIIKAKAEEIDAQKILNNQKMDDLIEKLGYMDYRDALACNKYIIEAKRSGDYHQMARGKILEVAFSRMTAEKRV